MIFRDCYQTFQFPSGWFAIALNLETREIDPLGGPYPSRREARERLDEFKLRDTDILMEGFEAIIEGAAERAALGEADVPRSRPVRPPRGPTRTRRRAGGAAARRRAGGAAD